MNKDNQPPRYVTLMVALPERHFYNGQQSYG